jgi:hypothetical protein
MPEDDYTGVLDDDFDDYLDPTIEDDLSWDELDDEGFDDGFENPDETIVNVIDAVEGAKSLQDAAERLYVLADELLSLAAIGWELMDDMMGGHGVALMVGDDDEDGL